MSRWPSQQSRPSDAMLKFLYVDLGWGSADIGWLIERDRTTVRKHLIRAGVVLKRKSRAPAARPRPPGELHFIELAEQAELGWTVAQARAAFADAVRHTVFMG